MTSEFLAEYPWESFSRRNNIFGMKVGKSKRLKIVYRSAPHLRKSKPYKQFLFSLDEYTRWYWLNDEKKFYPKFSLRYYNQKRKNRGWRVISPLEWTTDY